MGRRCRASVIRRPTSTPFGGGFSVWQSLRASEESRSMSWMTRGGSSSALGQSLLRYPLSELARLRAAPTTKDATPAAPYDCFVDGRGGQTSGDTKGDYACWVGRARKRPPDEGGVCPSKGFG